METLKKKIYLFLFYVYGGFACVHIYAVCVHSALLRPKEGIGTPRNWSYSQLWNWS